METITEFWIKFLFFFKKYSLIVLGTGWIILGSVVYFYPSYNGTSPLAGILEISAGVLFIAYYFFKKRKTTRR